MNKTSIFAIGLISGILLSYLFHKQPDTSPIVQKEPDIESTPRQAVSKQPQGPIHKTSENQNAVITPQTATTETVEIKETAQAPKKKIEVSLSETDVVNLENQWSNLPHQAQVTREVRGWRIKMIQPDTILFNAGLREGNLITTDFVQDLATESSDPRLGSRVANILNHISIQQA